MLKYFEPVSDRSLTTDPRWLEPGSQWPVKVFCPSGKSKLCYSQKEIQEFLGSGVGHRLTQKREVSATGWRSPRCTCKVSVGSVSRSEEN